MRTVLVTGGTGFLGSKIVELLIRDGCRVIILVREKSALKRLNRFINNPALHKIFINDNKSNSIFLKYKIDAVMHTATCYGRNNESWTEIAEANLLLPLRLLIEGERAGIKCFINADTFFNKKMGFDNNERYYVSTKKNFLAIAQNTAKQFKIKFINFKIEQMYGPDDSYKKFIPSLINLLSLNTKNIALTSGEQKRDFVFVNDVAKAFLCAYKNYSTLKSYEEFGIGSGSSVAIKRVVQYLKEVINSRSILNFGELNYRKNEIMDSRANLLNNKKINWHSEVDWRDGLTKTIKYHNN